MSSVETGQMSAVETGQMFAAETGQMSAVGTRQMSTIETGLCPVSLFYICLVSAEDICLVSTADICPVSTADICPVSTADISISIHHSASAFSINNQAASWVSTTVRSLFEPTAPPCTESRYNSNGQGCLASYRQMKIAFFGPGRQIFSNLNVAGRMQPGSPSPDQNKRETAISILFLWVCVMHL